jgi:hypothetical protein
MQIDGEEGDERPEKYRSETFQDIARRSRLWVWTAGVTSRLVHELADEPTQPLVR